MTTSHNHSAFTVSDLERSAAFYCDVMGHPGGLRYFGYVAIVLVL